MRVLFFIMFCVMLTLLIILVDWQEKLAELAHGNKLKQIAGLLESDSIPAQVDTAASDTSEQVNPELSQNGSTEGLWMADLPLPLQTEQGLVLPPSMAPLPSEPAPPRKHDTRAGESTPSRPFRDVSEEPYLNESRRLLRQIRHNYESILQGKGTQTQEQNQP